MLFRRLLLPAIFLPTLICNSAWSQASANQQQIVQHSQAAQNYLHQQRPDLAIPELEKVVALDPDNVDAQGNLGVLLYFRGDFNGAVPELRKAVQLKPDLWKIQALLGLAEGRLNNASSSREDLAAAFPHLQEVKLKNEVGSALVANYNATGDLEKSAAIVSSLLEAEPDNATLIFNAYQLYSQLADRAMLSLALAAPGSAQMHQVMARELRRHGDDEMAITNYREALKLDPHLAGAHFELGNILYNSDDEKHKAEAEEQFKDAIAENPQDEKAELMLGAIAAKRADWSAAIDYDTRALTLQPDDSDASMELAKALIATNEREKARKLIEHAIQVDPTDYIAHYRLSSLYRQQGRPADAEKQLAEYRKYKAMKDKLQNIFHDMRVSSGTGTQLDDDAQK